MSATEVLDIVQLVCTTVLLAKITTSEFRREHKVCFGASWRHTKSFWAAKKSPKECDLWVEYIWIPEIMIYDWVQKGHTNLNIFFFFLSSKQSNLTFSNWLHPKIAFICRFLTQTATWRPNYTIATSSVIAIRKVMTDTVFLGPSLGVVWFFFYDGKFSQRERVLWSWLAGPSHMR